MAGRVCGCGLVLCGGRGASTGRCLSNSTICRGVNPRGDCRRGSRVSAAVAARSEPHVRGVRRVGAPRRCAGGERGRRRAPGDVGVEGRRVGPAARSPGAARRSQQGRRRGGHQSSEYSLRTGDSTSTSACETVHNDTFNRAHIPGLSCSFPYDLIIIFILSLIEDRCWLHYFFEDLWASLGSHS